MFEVPEDDTGDDRGVERGMEVVWKLRDKVVDSGGRDMVAKLGAAAAANAGSNRSATISAGSWSKALEGTHYPNSARRMRVSRLNPVRTRGFRVSLAS